MVHVRVVSTVGGIQVHVHVVFGVICSQLLESHVTLNLNFVFDFTPVPTPNCTFGYSLDIGGYLKSAIEAQKVAQ